MPKTIKKTSKEDLPKFSIKGMEIKNVRKINDTVLAFSLVGNGVGLYGMKVVKGKNGAFIATPSQKGKDGNYYPIYNVYFDDDDSKKLMKEVAAIYRDQDVDDSDDDDLPF